MENEDIMRAIVDPKYRAQLMESTGVTEEELKKHMDNLVDNTHPSVAVI